MVELCSDPIFMQNRELSWLRFNERVLFEAEDESVPLLERLKFISIFTSNLDEFFMIRVGSLFDIMALKEETVDNKSGMTAREQLEKIYQAVRPLYVQRELLFNQIELLLRHYGVSRLTPRELESTERKFIKNYFRNNINPVLSPQIIDTHHPFPHFQNKVNHVCAMLRHKNKEVFGVVPAPSSLPGIIFLPGNDVRYIRLEDILQEYLPDIFSMYSVLESVQLCITRNGDIHTDENVVDVDLDFRNKMKKLLTQRRRLAPVRLELSNQISSKLEAYLCEKLGIIPNQIYISSVPQNLGYTFSLEGRLSPPVRKILTYEKFSPCQPEGISPHESMLRQVEKKDILLSYPYESMEPFLRMMKEAANDPSVVSIKITIYRLASKTKLVEYLCAAAENGKDVTVLIELRARFDEQNNIDWSERLEEAGCRIIYGMEGYKVHSKICLITRREKNDIRYITQIGTGNYNEKTAAMYTDVSLITANREIGLDAAEFFKNMSIGNLNGSYQHLLVAPFTLKSSILHLIEEEMAKGEQGRILIKLNSITDADIIKKLEEASRQGVRIQLIVRGICCILPGVATRTENVFVTNVVGRFLEHSRIYCFGQGTEEKMYISSADLMTRNTERRVEVACPIYSQAVRDKLHHILQIVLQDNVKGRVMDHNGMYHKRPQTPPLVDSQLQLLREAQEAQEAAEYSLEKESLAQKLKGLFRKK